MLYNFFICRRMVVLAENIEDATYLVRKLVEEFNKYSLEVDTEKTEYMIIEVNRRWKR